MRDSSGSQTGRHKALDAEPKKVVERLSQHHRQPRDRSIVGCSSDADWAVCLVASQKEPGYERR